MITGIATGIILLTPTSMKIAGGKPPAIFNKKERMDLIESIKIGTQSG